MIGQVRLGRTVLAKHRAPAWQPGIGAFDDIRIQMRTTSGKRPLPRQLRHQRTNAFAMVPDLAVANGRLFVRNGQRQAAAIREDRIGAAASGTVEAFSAEDQFHS